MTRTNLIRLEIARKLQEWRGRSGMSLQEASVQLGLAQDELKSLEEGVDAIPANLITNMVEKYGIDPNEASNFVIGIIEKMRS